ncbi:hypothetical protein QBC38DRAFT_473553 [Podospora fimiseda]|uniref:Uncharacterized protein n=1 Tax=Podospora fimiseda TaxID=252190 RepID=A0AAN7BTC6_9PEZI|nr:hypothetical protein QBC38DRAFT_473553 [Podospora fimiseda]
MKLNTWTGTEMPLHGKRYFDKAFVPPPPVWQVVVVPCSSHRQNKLGIPNDLDGRGLVREFSRQAWGLVGFLGDSRRGLMMMDGDDIGKQTGSILNSKRRLFSFPTNTGKLKVQQSLKDLAVCGLIGVRSMVTQALCPARSVRQHLVMQPVPWCHGGTGDEGKIQPLIFQRLPGCGKPFREMIFLIPNRHGVIGRGIRSWLKLLFDGEGRN